MENKCCIQYSGQCCFEDNNELLNLLQSIPNVKWKEAKYWTLI